MATVLEAVREEVRKYASKGLNSKAFSILDDEQQRYAVNTVGYPVRKRAMSVMVMARVEGDLVIIEEDRTDKPLVDALVQAGIPRQQIILAYAGETVPETSHN